MDTIGVTKTLASSFPLFRARAPWWGGDLQTLARVQGLVAEGRSVDEAINVSKVWKRRQPAIRAAQRRFAPAAVDAAVAAI